MIPTPFTAMQAAVDIVHSSEHPTNKIAAAIFNEEARWQYACTNLWPDIIERTIGRDARIGNASGTIHAETACIFEAAFRHNHATEGAAIAVTDPPCPNCVKNLAEAGIAQIYIDHKGFDKDFAKRRSGYFEDMSLRLAEKAGISTYEINRKDKTVIPISLAARHYHPADERPVLIEPADTPPPVFADNVKSASALCMPGTGKVVRITAPSHAAIGFQSRADSYEINNPETKYSYIQEACNRLLMSAARHGFHIVDQEIWCSETPTNREQVNMIGAGIKTLRIRRPDKSRDEHAQQGLQLIKEQKLMRVVTE